MLHGGGLKDALNRGIQHRVEFTIGLIGRKSLNQSSRKACDDAGIAAQPRVAFVPRAAGLHRNKDTLVAPSKMLLSTEDRRLIGIGYLPRVHCHRLLQGRRCRAYLPLFRVKHYRDCIRLSTAPRMTA